MEEVTYILDNVFNMEKIVYEYGKVVGHFINYYKLKDTGIRYFYNKKDRGDIHEGLLAIALISLACAEKPKINSNEKYEEICNFCECRKEYDKVEFEERLKAVVKEEVVKLLVDIFWEFDKAIYERYGAEAAKFLGRKSIVAGFFRAIGKYLKVNGYFEREKLFEHIPLALKELSNRLIKNINVFNITDIKDMISKTNVGLYNISSILEVSTYYVTLGLLLDMKEKPTYAKIPSDKSKNSIAKYIYCLEKEIQLISQNIDN